MTRVKSSHLGEISSQVKSKLATRVRVSDLTCYNTVEVSQVHARDEKITLQTLNYKQKGTDCEIKVLQFLMQMDLIQDNR